MSFILTDGRLTALAQCAYLAYGNATDGKNYQGLPMPDWAALGPTIQQAWRQAAAEIASTTMRAMQNDAGAVPEPAVRDGDYFTPAGEQINFAVDMQADRATFYVDHRAVITVPMELLDALRSMSFHQQQIVIEGRTADAPEPPPAAEGEPVSYPLPAEPEPTSESETAAILADPQAVADIALGQADVGAGRVVAADDLAVLWVPGAKGIRCPSTNVDQQCEYLINHPRVIGPYERRLPVDRYDHGCPSGGGWWNIFPEPEVKYAPRPAGGPSVVELARVMHEAQAAVRGVPAVWDALPESARQPYVRAVLAVFDAARVAL